MATGASTAGLAIVLIDARYGVLPQSRRHAFIASLLGIPQIVVAVNNGSGGLLEAVFNAIRDEFTAFSAQLDSGIITFIPMSALGATTWCAKPAPCRGTKGRLCWSIWKRSP